MKDLKITEEYPKVRYSSMNVVQIQWFVAINHSIKKLPNKSTSPIGLNLSGGSPQSNQ